MARWFLAPDRRTFARHVWNLADVIVILTPLVVLRFREHWTGVIRVFRLARLLWIGGRLWGRKNRTSRRSQIKWMLLVAACTVGTAGVLVWLAERDEPKIDTTIVTLWDALWWAVVTMSTVGYGDRIPASTTGKAAAIVLMVTGIALFGWVTAILASSFLESGAEKEAKKQRDEMERKLGFLAWQLKQLQPQSAGFDEGRVQSQGGASDAPSLAVREKVWPTDVYEPKTAGKASVDWNEEEVGIEWGVAKRRATRTMRWVGNGWGSLACKEGFWYTFAGLLYFLALAQAYESTDEFWRAAGITLPFFVWVLFLRRCWHWAGWLQFGLFLVVALFFGAEVSLWLLWPLLVIGIGLTHWERRATHRASVERLTAHIGRSRDGGGRHFARLGEARPRESPEGKSSLDSSSPRADGSGSLDD